jgi:glyoxylase-like metal-dependent hydrolase (beta-lactamase superfamily II)
MTQQVPLGGEHQAGHAAPGGLQEVLPDIAVLKLVIVNVILVGLPGAGDRGWVLVDAGLPGMLDRIKSAAEQRFGVRARPAAIMLTHGHFDHVGVLEDLARDWDTPVFAHALEHPYLDGTAAYPPPDRKVGGGILSFLSPLFPRGPVNVVDRLVALPQGGAIPRMSGWRWIHTPGHAVGHVSLWREADRTLIAGDAFITTAQESVYASTTQAPEMHGPPMYFTQDWPSARKSVVELAGLAPEIAVTGHGRAMKGETMRAALSTLARDFERVAHPLKARYLDNPVRAEDGSAYIVR